MSNLDELMLWAREQSDALTHVGIDIAKPGGDSTSMCVLMMRDGAMRRIDSLYDQVCRDLQRDVLRRLWKWVPVSSCGRKRVRLPLACGPMRARRRRCHVKQWNAPRHLPRFQPTPPLTKGQAMYGSPDGVDALAYAMAVANGFGMEFGHWDGIRFVRKVFSRADVMLGEESSRDA